jgi:hypothetical protein
MVKLITKGLQEFELNPKYEKILNNLKAEILNMETILKDPENYIYEEMAELKRQVDLDRERLKFQIDLLANDLIGKLEAYETMFKVEYNSNETLKLYNDLVESSRKQLAEYEQSLSLFSAKKELRAKMSSQSQNKIKTLQTKTNELKDDLFSRVSLKYTPMKANIQDLFGQLKIKVKMITNSIEINHHFRLISFSRTPKIENKFKVSLKRNLNDMHWH